MSIVFEDDKVILSDGTEIPAFPDGWNEGCPYSALFLLDFRNEYSQEFTCYLISANKPLVEMPWDMVPDKDEMLFRDVNIVSAQPGVMKLAMYYSSGGKWSDVMAEDTPLPMTLGTPTGIIVWSNHDIFRLTAYNPADGSYTIGTEIAYKSDEATKPPIILPDGTELPALPDDVLAEYPNAVIYKIGGSTIAAMFSKKPFAYGSANFYASLGITVVGPAIGTLGNGVLYRLNGELEKASDFTPAQSVVVVGNGLYDLLWSNHNIMVVQSANLSTMTANTNGEVYYAVDDVLVLKDGTKLLAPPKETFEELPYGIVFEFASGYYTFMAAEKQFVACREDMLPSDTVLGSDDTHGIMAQPGKWKRWFAGEEWTLDTEKTAEKLDGLYVLRVAEWANHDLYELSELNADYTYTIGSEIARKSDVNYRVTGGYMTSIANEGRRLGGVAGEMKPDVLESTLRGVTSGGGGGLAPNERVYQVGNATATISENDISWTTTATGSVS